MTTNGGQLLDKFDDYPKFLGVYPKDDLINYKAFKPGCAIIFNLDEKDDPGTHWTCAIYTKKGIFYIDSLGFDAPVNICKFLIKASKTKKYYYSDEQYQPERSTNCGKYTTYFISNFFNDKPFNIGLKANACKKNDIVVDTFFEII